MSFGTLDRKTAILWVSCLAVIGMLGFVVLADRSPSGVAASESVPMAEKRLERLRQIAATVSGKETLMKQVSAELGTREKGMLKAETGAQAQAQLQDLLHKVGASNGIDIRCVEDARIKPFGNAYGEVSVTVRFSCLIEQLVNLLAALANEPELLSTDETPIPGKREQNKD